MAPQEPVQRLPLYPGLGGGPAHVALVLLHQPGEVLAPGGQLGALDGVPIGRRLGHGQARGGTRDRERAAQPSGDGRRAAAIDSPGDERAVRTMISGEGGVDLMLLVVAAN